MQRDMVCTRAITTGKKKNHKTTHDRCVPCVRLPLLLVQALRQVAPVRALEHQGQGREHGAQQRDDVGVRRQRAQGPQLAEVRLGAKGVGGRRGKRRTGVGDRTNVSCDEMSARDQS